MLLRLWPKCRSTNPRYVPSSTCSNDSSDSKSNSRKRNRKKSQKNLAIRNSPEAGRRRVQPSLHFSPAACHWADALCRVTARAVVTLCRHATAGTIHHTGAGVVSLGSTHRAHTWDVASVQLKAYHTSTGPSRANIPTLSRAPDCPDGPDPSAVHRATGEFSGGGRMQPTWSNQAKPSHTKPAKPAKPASKQRHPHQSNKLTFHRARPAPAFARRRPSLPLCSAHGSASQRWQDGRLRPGPRLRLRLRMTNRSVNPPRVGLCCFSEECRRWELLRSR